MMKLKEKKTKSHCQVSSLGIDAHKRLTQAARQVGNTRAGNTRAQRSQKRKTVIKADYEPETSEDGLKMG